jgi:hypothetical protein
MQGAQLRWCHRSGTGLAELRRRWPSPPRAAPSPPLLLVRRRREGEAGRLGFGGAAGALIPGARVWERLRPAVLDGRARTRGGIAVARASQARVAVKARWKRGARAVALSCHEAGRRAGWRVTQASGAAAEEEKGKRRVWRLRPLSRSGRAAGGASGAGLLREEERGKLTGGARSSAAPGEGEGAHRGAAVGGLGRVGRVWKEGEGNEKGGNGARLGRCLRVGYAGP